MGTSAIDWNALDLLPKLQCFVCELFSVPWGRTPDDKYFCSHRCCDQYRGLCETAPPKLLDASSAAQIVAPYTRSTACEFPRAVLLSGSDAIVEASPPRGRPVAPLIIPQSP